MATIIAYSFLAAIVGVIAYAGWDIFKAMADDRSSDPE